jgi:hypothetical protein
MPKPSVSGPRWVKGPRIHLKDCIPKLCKPWQQTTEWFVFGLRLKDHHQPWHDKLQFHPEFRHWEPWKHAACCSFWYESSPLFGTQWIDTHDTQLVLDPLVDQHQQQMCPLANAALGTASPHMCKIQTKTIMNSKIKKHSKTKFLYSI